MIRVRLGGSLLEAWERVVNDRKVTQQDALVGLIEFIVNEDPLTQAMIFKQVPIEDRAGLTTLVLRRLAESGGKGDGPRRGKEGKG